MAVKTTPTQMGYPHLTVWDGCPTENTRTRGFGLTLTLTSSHQNFSGPPSLQALSSPYPRLALGMVSSHSRPPTESFPTRETASHLLYLRNTYSYQNRFR